MWSACSDRRKNIFTGLFSVHCISLSCHEQVSLTRLRFEKYFSYERPMSFSFNEQTFWLLVLTLLPDFWEISRSCPVQVPNYWTWTMGTPRKSWFSRSNPYKNWGYDNFSRKIARVTKFWSHDHIYCIIWVTWWNLVGDFTDKNYGVIDLFQIPFFLRRPRGANFPDIIEIVTVY